MTVKLIIKKDGEKNPHYIYINPIIVGSTIILHGILVDDTNEDIYKTFNKEPKQTFIDIRKFMDDNKIFLEEVLEIKYIYHQKISSWSMLNY